MRQQASLWARRWTGTGAYGGLPDGVEIAFSGVEPEALPWPEARAWDAASGKWSRVPLPAPARAHPETVVLVRDASVNFSGPVLTADGTVLAGPAWLTHADVEAHAMEMRVIFARGGNERFMDEAAWLCQPGDSVWGHWLLDLLPKAVTLDAVVPPGVPFLVSGHLPATIPELLTLAGVGARELVHLPAPPATMRVGRLWVANGARQAKAFDPGRGAVFDRVRHAVADGTRTSTKIMYTRAALDGARARRAHRILRTRDDVDKVASRLGFDLVIPERFSVPDQLRIASGAKITAGEGGSALFNALTAPRGGELVAIHPNAFRDVALAQIAGLRGLRLNLIPGRPCREPTASDPWSRGEWTESWTIPATAVADALEAL